MYFWYFIFQIEIIEKSIETSIDMADQIVNCLCLLQNTIINQEGFEWYLTEVSVKDRIVYWEAYKRYLNDSKALQNTFSRFFVHHSLEYLCQTQ